MPKFGVAPQNPSAKFLDKVSYLNFPLIPVSVQGGTASVGSAISMPATLYTYLAQCSSGLSTAIQNLSAELGVRVYPNPAANEVTITGGAIAGEKTQVSIFDGTGKQVFVSMGTSNEMKISTTNFAISIYIIQIQSAQTVATQKLIIK